MSTSRIRPVHLHLEPLLGLPVYLQIVRQVQRHTGTGRLPAGAQLPTVRALARQLGVNFNTVARAYRLLAHSGVLAAQPGRGTFVLTPSPGRKQINATLRELAADYVDGARRMHFSDAQIAAALKRQLGPQAASPRTGDSHE